MRFQKTKNSPNPFNIVDRQNFNIEFFVANNEYETIQQTAIKLPQTKKRYFPSPIIGTCVHPVIIDYGGGNKSHLFDDFKADYSCTHN